MSDEDPSRPPAPPWQAPSGRQRAPRPGWQQPPAPSAGVQTTMHEMTEQLQTVIDAAERAADAIRRDAEDQARQHMIDAQRRADQLTAERVGLISDLTDDLIRHAEIVRQHSELMVRALEDAISSVTGKLEQPGFHEPLSAPSAAYGDLARAEAPAPAEWADPPHPADPPIRRPPLQAPAPTGQPAPIPPPAQSASAGSGEEAGGGVPRPGDRRPDYRP